MTSEERNRCEIHTAKLATELGFATFNLQFVESSKAGFLGEVFKVKIIGKRDGKNETIHLVAKHIPLEFAKVDDWICERFHAEAQMYEKTFSLIDKLQDASKISKKLKHIKVYKTILERKQEAVIMEDVTVKGFKNCNLGGTVDLDHAELILEELARFHALSFALKLLTPKNYEELIRDIKEFFFHDMSKQPFKKIVADSIRHASEIIHDKEANNKLSKLEKEMSENYLEMIKKSRNSKNSIMLHGDVWTNNILFKYKENQVNHVLLIDWQTVRIGPPVLDVLFFLLVSVSGEVLSTKFQHLLNTYHKCLSSILHELDCNPDETYPYTSFNKDLQDFSKLPLTQVLIMLPIFTIKPEDYTEPNIDPSRDDVKALFGPEERNDEYISKARAGVKAMIDNELI